MLGLHRAFVGCCGLLEGNSKRRDAEQHSVFERSDALASEVCGTKDSRQLPRPATTAALLLLMRGRERRVGEGGG
jgi:hypothetical protein